MLLASLIREAVWEAAFVLGRRLLESSAPRIWKAAPVIRLLSLRLTEVEESDFDGVWCFAEDLFEQRMRWLRKQSFQQSVFSVESKLCCEWGCLYPYVLQGLGIRSLVISTLPTLTQSPVAWELLSQVFFVGLLVYLFLMRVIPMPVKPDLFHLITPV